MVKARRSILELLSIDDRVFHHVILLVKRYMAGNVVTDLRKTREVLANPEVA